MEASMTDCISQYSVPMGGLIDLRIGSRDDDDLVFGYLIFARET